MCFVRFIQSFIIKPPSPSPYVVTPLTLGMAVALRFGIAILQSDWTGDAACVDSDLNRFGEVAEARML